MKATKLSLRVHAPSAGTQVEAGYCNRTSLAINGQGVEVGPNEDNSPWVVPQFAVGDHLVLSIPSGVWEGQIIELSMAEGGQRFKVAADWDGRQNGLIGGMSGMLYWEVLHSPRAMVETSMSSVPVPYEVYRFLMDFLDVSVGHFVAAKRQAVGRAILDVLKEGGK